MHMLMAVDDGLRSNALMDWAIERAGNSQWTLEIVMIRDDTGSSMHTERAQLYDLKADVLVRSPRATVTTAVIDGPVAESLVDRSGDVELLIIGNAPRTPRPGSDPALALRVASHAQCPTVVVPAGWAPSGGGAVVVGLGDAGVDDERELVELAAREAGRRGVPLEIVHAFQIPAAPLDPLSLLSGWQRSIRAANQKFVELACRSVRKEHPSLSVLGYPIDERPARALLSRTGMSLIVIGSRGRGPLASLLLGSTGRDLLRDTIAPVMVIPDARTGASAD